MWKDKDVQTAGEGAKTVRHPIAGDITFEFSSSAVDGRPDLKMMIYNPADEGELEKMRRLCSSDGAA